MDVVIPRPKNLDLGISVRARAHGLKLDSTKKIARCARKLDSNVPTVVVCNPSGLMCHAIICCDQNLTHEVLNKVP